MSSTSRYSSNPILPGTKCCAKYNYPAGLSIHELTFNKGDILTIISATKDPNWYKARRLDGREGMIPISYVTELGVSQPTSSPPPPLPSKSKPVPEQPHQPKQFDLYDMPWYHGNLSRQDAEKLLINTKNGTFLVRDSACYTDDYTISVFYADNIEHYRVCKDRTGNITVDKETYFQDLISLIKHHQTKADGLCTRLKFVLEKTSGASSRKENTYKISIIPAAELKTINQLGQGEFGDALWLGYYKETPVVVKMLESIKGTEATQLFLNEVSVMMSHVHPNVVQLIGVSLETQPICVVKEYMAKGTLEQYLRSRSKAVVTKSQLGFARDICSGMAYLESKSIIHRNLTSRHILLADTLTAKVSKFWVSCKGKSCPVKWAAPETLKGNNFTLKSDVWSFGILLWEIYSCGRMPYPRIPTADVITQIEKGYRMDPPEGCPDNIYKIMKNCWSSQTRSRPAFYEIKRLLL